MKIIILSINNIFLIQVQIIFIMIMYMKAPKVSEIAVFGGLFGPSLVHGVGGGPKATKSD